MTRPVTPLLDQVPTPEELRRLPEASLKQLADELRARLAAAIETAGGIVDAGLADPGGDAATG